MLPEPNDLCDHCGHERWVHNHPDVGQCTEIVEYHGRSMPTTCGCEGFEEERP